MLVFSLVCTIPVSASHASSNFNSVPLEFANTRSLGGIDLRDAQNKPIARADVDRGIRSGVRAQQNRAASLSKLPGLRQLLAYLDQLDQLAPKLKTPDRESAARIIPAAHRVPKRAKMKVPEIKSFPLAPVAHTMRPLNPLMLSSTPGRVRVRPLLL